MLFDPKIKHNGKIRNIQLVDPNNVTLKNFSKIKNEMIQNSKNLSFEISDSDSIIQAISKLDCRTHVSNNTNNFSVDYDAMKKLYGNSIFSSNNDILDLTDGMHILFNKPLKYLTEARLNLAMAYLLNDIEDISQGFQIDYVPCSILNTSNNRCFLISRFFPTNIGNYDMSEFAYKYLLAESVSSESNYITVLKSNIKWIKFGLV